MKIAIKNITASLAAMLVIFSTGIAASSPIIITHSSSMPPLAFINGNGKPDGVLIDFWKEWAKQAGKEIEFKLQPWKKSVQETANGKADINAGMFYSKKRAERMCYGDYIFHFKGGLFASQKIIKNNKINKGESCGVIKSGYAKIFMERHHPYTPLTLFNSAWEMYNAAAEERLNMFVADYPVAVYQMNEFDITDSFQLIQELYTRDLYPTVSKNNPELIKVININMASISPEKKQAIMNKWLNLAAKGKSQRRIAGAIALLAFLMMTYLHRNEIRAALKIIRNKFTGQS